jgi:hypothetical protein
MVEQVPYQVIRELSGCEIRDYSEHSLVSIDLHGDLSSTSTSAFRPLFSYISGENTSAQKVAMTAPVFQEETAVNEHRISFAMPSSLSPETVPTPRNSQLSVVVVPGHLAAAMQFRGSWDEKRVKEKGDQLLAVVADAGLDADGPIIFARYNPPFYPPILRRNEVIVKLAGSEVNRKILGLEELVDPRETTFTPET